MGEMRHSDITLFGISPQSKRRKLLNIVPGGFKNDLIAFNDQTPHDERSDRAVEYALIVKALRASEDQVSFGGRYYG
jgi:alkanesulfonate monooxygenase SsuD/methylene tetrahydromethanopterin reductase-like flavin-dependent oxidoreductase (luciferase family)